MQGCTWTETGTEENLFVLETLAKAEGCLQAVVEWEEDGDLEPVRADDHREGGERSAGGLHILSSVHTGLLQAGEGRGPADDSGPLENAPCHWWDRYPCSSLWGVIHETRIWGLGPADPLVSRVDMVPGLKELTVCGGAGTGPGTAATKPGSLLSALSSLLSASPLVPTLSSTLLLPALALGGAHLHRLSLQVPHLNPYPP